MKNTIQLLNKYTGSPAAIEKELILADILNCKRKDLFVKNIEITEDIESSYDVSIKRLLKRVPLQHITRSARFMERDFFVNEDVLIPRPETELLVTEILTIHGSRFTANILDLCTGSGNIAVSLALALPDISISATDISDKAINIARRNAVTHHVEEKIKFYVGDLFKALSFDKNNKFDIIVCNPPYIKSSELDFLQEEVRQEPKPALDGGEDGLMFYRYLAQNSRRYLGEKGSLVLEIGKDQLLYIEDIFKQWSYKIKRTKKDFQGIERVVWIGL
ncbi:MAG: peptide chain release factor N(5)-glutamine methyltransferase [Candidatus Omnitrophota bacterium]